MYKFKKNDGFTLAEVLITLAIIGVVAAMSIPSIVASTNKAEYVTALKKFHATFSGVLSRYMADNYVIGDLSSAQIFDNGDHSKAWNALKPYLNVAKDCGISVNQKCWSPEGIHELNGAFRADINTASLPKAQLADGMSIYMTTVSANCTYSPGSGILSTSSGGGVCGEITVDVNGHKKPNRYGRDIFEFSITKKGTLYPRGGSLGTWTWKSAPNSTITCTDSSTDGGIFCAGRIIEEGWEMNY